jgi:MSHA biogenesis protein MshP
VRQARAPSALPSSERGFALIAAIFLIVVLAALGVFAVRMAVTQQQTSSLALLEARTLAAAQSGIEYGANRALASPSTCALSTTLTLSGGALAGYTVVVTCNPTPHTGTTSTSFALTATAFMGTYGTPDFVSRKASRTVASP